MNVERIGSLDSREQQEDTSRNHPFIGTKVGQFEIVELVGGGAMGLVFKAYQKSVDRMVAIKFLSYDLKGDELAQRRMEREAKAMGRLNHPGLISTYEMGISDFGQPYIVMEYIEGVAFSDILMNEGPLSVERTISICIQIADAMQVAHEHGVVHRDLKPHNVMICDKPWPDFVKVFDFGIARVTADSQNLTCAGSVMGSPLYMSPEQCLGEPTDARSDIYSLGVLLFQSLTADFPICGEDAHSTMTLKVKQAPRRLKEAAPKLVLPHGLELLAMTMLSADPRLRPESMSVVRAELERIEAEMTGSNRKAQRIYPVSQAMPDATINDREGQENTRPAAVETLAHSELRKLLNRVSASNRMEVSSARGSAAAAMTIGIALLLSCLAAALALNPSLLLNLPSRTVVKVKPSGDEATGITGPAKVSSQPSLPVSNPKAARANSSTGSPDTAGGAPSGVLDTAVSKSTDRANSKASGASRPAPEKRSGVKRVMSTSSPKENAKPVNRSKKKSRSNKVTVRSKPKSVNTATPASRQKPVKFADLDPASQNKLRSEMFQYYRSKHKQMQQMRKRYNRMHRKPPRRPPHRPFHDREFGGGTYNRSDYVRNY